jgi:hypothetical protein
MALVAVLSNPQSDGNKSHLDRVRAFCAGCSEIEHIEMQRSEDVGIALNRISLSRPRVLVVNGGDGTVQSVLTELFGEGSPDRYLPPIAVLPNGKTNLIAKDLGGTGDPIAALERVVALAQGGTAANVVRRQLISLDTGDGQKPQLGMFLAAGALADVLLFCRHKLYPTGMSNGLAHALTVVAGLISVITDWNSRFLPPKPKEISLTVGKERLRGRFQVLMVSTLRTLVLSGRTPPEKQGTLQLLAMERRRMTMLRAVITTLLGRLGRTQIRGVHMMMGDRIAIEDERAAVIMDGELFVAAPGKAMVLTPTRNVQFLDLAHRVAVADSVADVPVLSPMPQPSVQTAIAAFSPEPR